MRTVKLITEDIQDVQFIAEDTADGKKNYKIRGVFMQADIKNRNGRVYPMEVLTNEVNKYSKNFIQKKRAFGELGHPEGPTVNLERASHLITSLVPEGKNFIGEAKIMDTPMGKIVKSLMDEGATLGVSSRGGANYVNKDFMLATAADIVADPSAPSAFVEGIMEGKEWVWDNGSYLEPHLVEMKQRLERGKAANQALEFAKFLKML